MFVFNDLVLWIRILDWHLYRFYVEFNIIVFKH